jgi:hypothetical protein
MVKQKKQSCGVGAAAATSSIILVEPYPVPEPQCDAAPTINVPASEAQAYVQYRYMQKEIAFTVAQKVL